MGSDRRTFFNQLVNVGALSGLAAMLPSDAFAKIESTLLGETPTAGIQVRGTDGVTRTYFFHAHAHAIRPDTNNPPTIELESKASVHLPEEGGFRSQFLEDYRSEGVSFKSAYVQVAGTRSNKAGYGWVSLATSFVTGLNVHDMVTADLVFSQVSTEHPIIGRVPSVTFLGTRFENLRVAGQIVEPVLDLNICGSKPAGDKPYIQDQGFLSRVSEQYDRIGKTPGLPESTRQQYHWDSAAAAQRGKVECSLVTNLAGATQGMSYGNIIEIPGFGKVSLAELEVGRAFNLMMIGVDLGKGRKWRIADVASNGTHHP
jgi:hypothetical protein